MRRGAGIGRIRTDMSEVSVHTPGS
jgi:hypothetical protein